MKLSAAQVTHLRSLETADGVITPDAVVMDAKRKESPLHALFEWDTKKAANRYWLECAREIIASVRVVVTTQEHTIRAPHYVHDPSLPGQGYRTVTALANNPAAARESLIYTIEAAAGHLRRAQDLAVPLGLTNEIDELLERIAGVRLRILTTAA